MWPKAIQPSCSPLAAVNAGTLGHAGPPVGSAGGAGSACSLFCFLLEYQLNKRQSGGVCSVARRPLFKKSVNTDSRVAHPFLSSCV